MMKKNVLLLLCITTGALYSGDKKKLLICTKPPFGQSTNKIPLSPSAASPFVVTEPISAAQSDLSSPLSQAPMPSPATHTLTSNASDHQSRSYSFRPSGADGNQSQQSSESGTPHTDTPQSSEQSSEPDTPRSPSTKCHCVSGYRIKGCGCLLVLAAVAGITATKLAGAW